MKTILAASLVKGDVIVTEMGTGQVFRTIVSDWDYTANGQIKVYVDDGAATYFYDFHERVVVE